MSRTKRGQLQDVSAIEKLSRIRSIIRRMELDEHAFAIIMEIWD